MPLDATGAFRHNHESAQMHSEAAGKKYSPDGDQGHEDEGNGDHVEIHSHGDGTFHTIHQGERVEHETHGHALIHAAKAQAEEGHKHFVAHHDGEELHTHSSANGEEPEHRDHDPENIEAAKEHLDQFFNEEKGEQGDEKEPAGKGEGLGGLY